MSTDPLVGRVLEDRYEITSKIARGGMATVYRAHDLHLGRTVAVKVIHEGLDAELSRRFDTEAKAAARLVNPHIVSVFDQGADEGRAYIVMEYVPGCTLRHVITREAPLPPLRALDLLEPVVSALASAHEDGLVHRDVKPENVLISDRGQIKVADFGLARAVTNQTISATNGQLIGTVSYIPPELVTSGRADERSDVYSAGIVLFEMLTGSKPHTGGSPIQVAWAHVNEDIPAPSDFLAGQSGPSQDLAARIPDFLDAIVRTCTARDPRRRPADARSMLDLIRRARRAIVTRQGSDPVLTALLAKLGPTAPEGGAPRTTQPRSGATDDTEDSWPREPFGRVIPAARTNPSRPIHQPTPPDPTSRPLPAHRHESHPLRGSATMAGTEPRWPAPRPVDRVRTTRSSGTARARGWAPSSVPRGSVPGPTVGRRQSAGGQPGSTRPQTARIPGPAHPQTASRLAQDPVHRRRRGALLILVIVALAVVLALLGHRLAVSHRQDGAAPVLSAHTAASVRNVTSMGRGDTNSAVRRDIQKVSWA